MRWAGLLSGGTYVAFIGATQDQPCAGLGDAFGTPPKAERQVGFTMKNTTRRRCSGWGAGLPLDVIQWGRPGGLPPTVSLGTVSTTHDKYGMFGKLRTADRLEAVYLPLAIDFVQPEPRHVSLRLLLVDESDIDRSHVVALDMTLVDDPLEGEPVP